MADAPRATLLYNKLTQEQQTDFWKRVVEKLKTLIGGYGELSVLAEYIAVMLQSSRPPEQIQSELEAFLQDQSGPFTRWLCDEISTYANKDEGSTRGEARGEALLLRAVRDARQAPLGTKERKAKKTERAERKAERNREKSAPAPVAEVAAERSPVAARRKDRSRSRDRRRRRQPPDDGGVIEDDGPEAKGSASSRAREAERKAVLTPNVQFLRDAYHQKVEPVPGQAPDPREGPPLDTRWHFRADQPMGAPPDVMHAPQRPQEHGMHAQYGMPPGQQHGGPHMPPHTPYGMPPGHHGAPPGGMPPPRPIEHNLGPPPARPPRNFAPKKWKVVRPDTVVRSTEALNSDKIQTLQEGEIVEQVAPSFTLKNGIIRIQIRHPSSPQFPMPIGWITQDATAAGGPKFLEPGPKPMTRSNPSYRSSGPPPWQGGGSWRPNQGGPPAPATAWTPPSPRPAAPAPAGGPRGPNGFQNMVWTPQSSAGAGGGGGGPEAAAATG